MLNSPWQRVSYRLLCASPFLAGAVVAVRPLRVSVVHQAIGLVLCAMMSASAWVVGARSIRGDDDDRRLLSLAGVLLLAPFALMALLWVGLGTPWEATAAENQMRYLVLIAMAAAVVFGVWLLSEALDGAGERCWSMIGRAAISLAGPIYLVWNTFMFAAAFAREHAGQVPAAIVALDEALDLMLFVGGAMTYLATAAIAASMGRLAWLGRRATQAMIVLNVISLLCLVIRGVHFPDPKSMSAPWYTSPGFVAGIPAVPYIMPALLGAVVLRRAGADPK